MESHNNIGLKGPDTFTTTSSSTNPNTLPELPYSPRNHKRGVAIAWTFLVANTVLLPIALIYGLWYGTSMKHNAVLGVVAGTFAVATFFQYYKRLYRLLQKDPKYRPIGSKRGWLDFYHIANTISIFITAAFIVAGTAQHPPVLRLMGIAPSVLLLLVCTFLLVFIGLGRMGMRTPFRFSSLPKGSVIRPGIYVMIEDVIAVDAGAGIRYREALNARYEASPYFRTMLAKLNIFWAIGGECAAIIIIGLCYIKELGETAAFGIGWVLPFVWAGIWAIITIKWVQSDLRQEKAAWDNKIIG